MRAQAGSKTLDVRNPLGRVLKVGEENFKKDIDTLELKLAEALWLRDHQLKEELAL